MQNIKRSSKKFLYASNFSNGHALAILKPNIFGVSKIVQIDTDYKVIDKTSYFTYNNWFNGYLIAHEENSLGQWINFWLDGNLTIVPNTNSISGFSSLSFHLKTLESENAHFIETLLRVHPEILQNLQPIKGGKSYFISTPFCCPFIYTPNAGKFDTLKFIHSDN